MVHTPSSIKARKKKKLSKDIQEEKRQRKLRESGASTAGLTREGKKFVSKTGGRFAPEKEVITPTREPTPTRPEEPVRLGFETTTKEEALESLERGTRFSEVKELGVTGPEFGARKRELFAEEHPIEKGLLDAASLITIGLLAGKTIGAVKAAVAVGKVAGTFQATLSGGRAVVAARYATNVNSTALTKSW